MNCCVVKINVSYINSNYVMLMVGLSDNWIVIVNGRGH